MALVFYTDGVGGSTGDWLASATPLMATGVLYVDSVTGSDTYDGTQRTKPKATLASAFSAASNGFIIVLLSTHTEQIGSVVTVNLKNITVIGEGSSDGYPSAVLGGGNNVRITLSGDDCQVRGVRFTTSTVANSNPFINITGKRASVVGCKFELTGTDSSGVTFDALSDYGCLDGCTFISTSTSIASTPTYGCIVAHGGDGFEMYDTVFSDGLYGFTNYAFSYVSATFDNIRAHNISLLLGAEMNVGGSTYGYIHIGTSTGGGRVI